MQERSAQAPLRTDRQNTFETPLFLAATVGVPFAVFKLLFGALIIRDGVKDLNYLQVAVLGWPVVTWALIDLIMNLARIMLELLGRQSPIEFCSIAQVGRIFRRPRLFLAVDTLVSFSIISFVLWSGWISHLSLFESRLWYAATTVNLISIALASLWLELHRGTDGSCR